MGRPTDELRAVLDESGVDWREGVHMHDRTYFEEQGIQWRVTELDTGELSIDAYGLSPEQVASVTLGRGTCHAKQVTLWNGTHTYACGVCGRELPGGARFCPKCGRLIA